MNSSEREPLLNKKWRSITYNWDILSTYGNESNLYCLTDFQVAWLLSNTEYMRWKTRWSNCPCTQGDLDAMKAELEYNLMSCFDLQPYQLGYLFDQAQSAQFDAFNTAYDDGGIPELNPNTPTDFYSGDDSDARLDALCMACETYVKSYAQRWLQQAQLINSALNIIAGILSPVPFIQDMAVEVIGGLVGITQAKVNAMQDNTSLDAVVCCMKDGLNGGAVNQTIFEQSLDGCGFAFGSSPELVREIIASDIDRFNNWLSFLNALGDAFVYTNVGVDYFCPCDGLPLLRLGGFGNADMNVIPWDVPPYASTIGTYESANDLYRGGITFDNLNVLLRVTFTFASATALQTVKVFCTPHVTRDTPSSGYYLLADGVEQAFIGIPQTADPFETEFEFDFAGSSVTELEFRWIIGVAGANNGNVDFTRLEIET